MKREDWKIGEIKQVGDEFYICIESSDCPKCDLKGFHNCNIEFPCSTLSRKDGKEVIFKKLRKIGKHFTYKDKVFQKFKSSDKGQCKYCYFKDQVCNPEFCKEDSFLIEIKNKDMKEIDKVVINIDDRDYLLDRLEAILHDTHCQQYKDEICEAFSKYMVSKTTPDLKPFDLDAAKSGKPVCTRDGRKARIICFDAKGDFPIAALVETNNIEEVYPYTNNGLFHLESNDLESNYDLMMSPEKKEGWVNVYKSQIHYSLKSAEEGHKGITDYIKTIKVSWEE